MRNGVERTIVFVVVVVVVAMSVHPSVIVSVGRGGDGYRIKNI